MVIAVVKIAFSLLIVICRVWSLFLSALLYSVSLPVLILFFPILPNHLVLILIPPTLTNSSYPFSSFSSPTPTHMSPVAWYHSPSDDIWKPKKSKPPVPFPITSSFLPSSSSPVLRTPPPTRHFSSDLFSPKLRKLSKKSNDYIKLTSACETVVKQSHVNHSGTGQSSDAAW